MLLSGQGAVLGRWGILMLILPTGWFMFMALSPAFDTTRFAGLIWTVAMVIFIAAIGYILSILAWLLDNEGVTRSPAYRNRLIVIVLFVTIAGYLVGKNHQHFVFCQQFQIIISLTSARNHRYHQEIHHIQFQSP